MPIMMVGINDWKSANLFAGYIYSEDDLLQIK
jgi:hypothetical protein